ncbi:MAG: sodium/solute symporter [bacterium]
MSTMSTSALLIDGFIIILYFVSITAIGLYMGRRERSLEDYALGGRKMPWWAVMASIIAAETSAATFIGAPAEGFSTRGVIYVQLTIGLILGRIIVGHYFLKPYYKYRVYTVYDYLLVRFGIKSKNMVSGLFLIMRVLASGVRLYVPSLVLVLAWRLFVLHQPVTFQHLDTWVPYAWAIIILTIVTCIYTALGGIKAVIWTDLIQASLMFGSAVVAIGTILYHIGGGSIMNGFSVLGQHVPEMTTTKGYFLTGFENVKSGSTLWEIFKLVLANKYTIPAAVIATTIGNMAAFGTDQDMVQRMLTAKDYKKSRRSLVTAAFMDVPIAFCFTFIGVLLIAFYELNPALKPAKPNDVFGVYILNVMPVVIRGFVMAGVFATAMGSLSAALNALATTATNDWYIPYFARNKEEHHYVFAARVFTGVFAVLMIIVAVVFAIANVKNPTLTIIPIALGIAAYFLGPMLGLFLTGMFTKTRGSDKGNILALIAGVFTILLLSGKYYDLINFIIHLFSPSALGYTFPSWMPQIEFTWYAMAGAMATFFVSLLFRTPQHVLDAAIRREEEIKKAYPQE